MVDFRKKTLGPKDAFGSIFRRRREEAGVSLGAAAKKTGIPRHYLSALEEGRERRRQRGRRHQEEHRSKAREERGVKGELSEDAGKEETVGVQEKFKKITTSSPP